MIFLYIILAVLAALYVAMALVTFYVIRTLERRILNSKMGRRHPERFASPVWVDVLVAALWPLQIIGLLIGLLAFCTGKR